MRLYITQIGMLSEKQNISARLTFCFDYPCILTITQHHSPGQIDKTCDSTTDTFVDTTGWGKGVVFFQTQNLGRHWPLAGPQLTLYAPGPFCGGAEVNVYRDKLYSFQILVLKFIQSISI